MTPPQPQDAVTLFNQGIEQLQAGNYSVALTYFDSALAINPNDPNIWEKRASALQNLGNYAAALASNTIALRFYSGDIKLFDAEAWFDQGNQQAMAGDFVGAIASYDKALQFKPDYHQAWYNRGVALADLGQFEEAIASYDKALQFKSDDHQAWYNRGVALDKLGQFEQAIASYDKALEIKSDYHEAWINRGVVLDKLGKFEQAIASFDKALQIKPDYHNAWSNRGVVLENLGQIEEAIASFDKALQFKPDLHQSWNNRGVVLADLGQSEQGIASFDKALQFKPDDYEAWYNRGVALVDLGQFEQAIASYDKALQFKPDLLLAWCNRGFAAENSVSCDQQLASMSSIARQNPALNQRGYEGELASYQEGLKYCHQETHPEGWGELHRAIGNAHYFRGKGERDYRKYWHKAVAEYHQALITLTEEEKLRELHLGVVQDLVRVLFGLGKRAEAEELQRLGTDLLRHLLSEPKRSNYSKKQLALKFVSFQQLTVDQAVQSQQLVKALELAEKGKNACLTWLLAGYSEEISSPSYTEIQQLLNPTTAIIYWHLSPAALTSFIIKHGAEEPIVIKEPFPSPPVKPHDKPNLSFQHLHDFETWVNNWNKQYQEYRSKEKKSPPQPPLVRGEQEYNLKRGEQEIDKSWRDNLPEMLEHLGNILNIPAILSELIAILIPVSYRLTPPPAPPRHPEGSKTPVPPSLLGKGVRGLGLGVPHLSENRYTNINQLILIPHRDLHRFPLHALFPDNFTITYLPSAQIGITSSRPSLRVPNSSRLATDTFLNPPLKRGAGGVKPVASQTEIGTRGNPEPMGNLLSIEHPNSEGYDQLPYAELESAAITQLFNNPQRLAGKDATKTAVEAVLPTGYSIFHFTGHGTYNFNCPSQSALILSGKDKLTLEDILRLPLNSYQLVSLSSCETALTGNQTITTEYVGLVSAFLYQQVSHVVSTLWTVESAASALFMIKFYRLRSKGKPEAVALRKTQQWLRQLSAANLARLYPYVIHHPSLAKEHNIRPFLKTELRKLNKMAPTDKPYQHPYHWTAFTLTGFYKSDA